MNGTPTQEKPIEAPKPTPSPVVEKKPATALYILNAETEEQIRDLFPEEDKSKIKVISKFVRPTMPSWSTLTTMKTVVLPSIDSQRTGETGTGIPRSSTSDTSRNVPTIEASIIARAKVVPALGKEAVVALRIAIPVVATTAAGRVTATVGVAVGQLTALVAEVEAATIEAVE